jgi:hypothetical protein
MKPHFTKSIQSFTINTSLAVLYSPIKESDLTFCLPEHGQFTHSLWANPKCDPDYRSRDRWGPGLAPQKSALSTISLRNMTTVLHILPDQGFFSTKRTICDIFQLYPSLEETSCSLNSSQMHPPKQRKLGHMVLDPSVTYTPKNEKLKSHIRKWGRIEFDNLPKKYQLHLQQGHGHNAVLLDMDYIRRILRGPSSWIRSFLPSSVSGEDLVEAKRVFQDGIARARLGLGTPTDAARAAAYVLMGPALLKQLELSVDGKHFCLPCRQQP